jgi:hypothetical protein
MAFTISGLSEYTNKATEILRAGIFSNELVEFDMQTGIMYKEFLNFIDTDPTLVAGTCGSINSGDTTITERVITVIPMKSDQSYCFDDLYKKALGGLDVAKSITEDTAAKISKTVSKTIWEGNALGIDGFIAQLEADTDTNEVASSTLTTANIEAEIAKMVVLVNDAMYSRGELTLYVNYKTFNLYKVARLAVNSYRDQSTTFGTNEQWLNGYEGQIKIKAQLGIADNKMLLTWAKNLVIGTDEINQVSSAKWIIDEVTELAWLKSKFKLGTSYKYSTEAILYTAV